MKTGHLQGVESAGSVFFYCLVAFLLLAPLYKGGNAPVPLLLLETAAIGFIFVIAGVHQVSFALPRALMAGAGILFVYPLIQLIPLPNGLWRLLPGHAEYADVLDRFVVGGTSSLRHTISVIPSATEYGWLAVLPPLACLLAVLHLRPEHIRSLLLWMVAFAGCEALLGLLQAGLGGDSIFYLGNNRGYATAVGTFVNRNHLAAMLAMMLPVVIGWFAFSARRQRHLRKSGRATISATTLSQRVIVFVALVLILMCLILTRSRVGIGAALIGLACSSIVIARIRAGVKSAKLIVPIVVGAGMLLALVVGLSPVIERFEPREITQEQDGRSDAFKATMWAAIEFLPFGSGLSTFTGVFPRYQVGNLGGHIDSAHSDYLQAFMELGLVAPVIVALLCGAYALRMVELLRVERGRSFALLQIGAGIGILTIILHSLFDFALHMPAIAMWVATLSGVLFHAGAGARSSATSDVSEDQLPLGANKMNPPAAGPANEILSPRMASITETIRTQR